MRYLLVVLIAASFALAGCATNQPAAANPNFIKPEARGALPKKIVLLPVNVTVSEVSAGGVIEKVQAWSDQAKVNIEAALRKVAGDAKSFEVVPLPALTSEEKARIEQHLALYQLVGTDAFTYSRSQDPAWQHKKTGFDYTLGPGLQFMRAKTGADAAIVLVCSDYISSGGRQAMVALFTVLALATGNVVIPQGAPAFVSSGVIDLQSGDIQWLNYRVNTSGADLRKPQDAQTLVGQMMHAYPGISGK